MDPLRSSPISILHPRFDFWIIGFVAGLAALLLIFVKRNPPSADAQSTPASEASSPANTVAGKSFSDPSQAPRSLSLPSENERILMARQLAFERGRCDFATAREWVYAQNDDALRNDLLSQVGRAHIAYRPLEVMALMDAASNDDTRLSFLIEMIQAWTSEDSASAVEWVRQCNHPGKELIQAALAVKLARANPGKAAEYIAVEMGAGCAQDQVALMLATRWGRLDPKAASAWAHSLPPGNLQQRVLAAVSGFSAP